MIKEFVKVQLWRDDHDEWLDFYTSYDGTKFKCKCVYHSDLTIPLSWFDSHKINKILPGDQNVYFTQFSSLPKYKLKNYFEKEGIELHKTNRVEYAETFVLRYQAIKSFYTEFNQYC